MQAIFGVKEKEIASHYYMSIETNWDGGCQIRLEPRLIWTQSTVEPHNSSMFFTITVFSTILQVQMSKDGHSKNVHYYEVLLYSTALK